jgi:hypothetical protein
MRANRSAKCKAAVVRHPGARKLAAFKRFFRTNFRTRRRFRARAATPAPVLAHPYDARNVPPVSSKTLRIYNITRAKVNDAP